MLEDEKVPVSQLQPMPRGKAGRTSRCSRPLKSAAAELNRSAAQRRTPVSCEVSSLNSTIHPAH